MGWSYGKIINGRKCVVIELNKQDEETIRKVKDLYLEGKSTGEISDILQIQHILLIPYLKKIQSAWGIYKITSALTPLEKDQLELHALRCILQDKKTTLEQAASIMGMTTEKAADIIAIKNRWIEAEYWTNLGNSKTIGTYGDAKPRRRRRG